MPIEAHCPSPACARAHLVKNKYAGHRGKCPACGSWMYVPLLPAAPAPAPPPPAVERFGWAAAAFLVAGMAGLGLAAAAPFLPQPTLSATGELANALGDGPVGVRPQARLAVLLAPLAVLLLPLGALASAAFGRPTMLGRWLTYGSVLLASGLAFVAVHHLHRETGQLAALHKVIAESKAAGLSGDAVVRSGCCLHAAATGAILATGLFLLAAFALHRRFWSRVVGSVLLGLPLAVAALYTYRREVGLDAMPPFWEAR